MLLGYDEYGRKSVVQHLSPDNISEHSINTERPNDLFVSTHEVIRFTETEFRAYFTKLNIYDLSTTYYTKICLMSISFRAII